MTVEFIWGMYSLEMICDESTRLPQVGEAVHIEGWADLGEDKSFNVSNVVTFVTADPEDKRNPVIDMVRVMLS